MNIYDTKTIVCRSCKAPIGEIEYDTEVMLLQCGKCANPIPEGDNIVYTASYFQNTSHLKKSKVVEPLIH